MSAFVSMFHCTSLRSIIKDWDCKQFVTVEPKERAGMDVTFASSRYFLPSAGDYFNH